LKHLFTPLFSANGLARTHLAHRAPEGSFADGGECGSGPAPGRLLERWARGRAMPMMRPQVIQMTIQNGELAVLSYPSQT